MSVMLMGYLMFAGCLLWADTLLCGFNGCEVQLLLKPLLLGFWRLRETQCLAPEGGLGEDQPS